jgi:regulator of sigma E protease
VPPLDGGWLVFLAVEKVKGSALSERAQEAVAYVGITFILALLVYLTYNDVLNIFFR